MTEHTMKLEPSPFSQIKNGTKTIELRLYDEKRRKLSQGDIIHFCNTENTDEVISTKVIELYIFDTFEELYKDLPLLECGYTKDDISEASPKDMEKYYSLERQNRFGVVGIHVVLI